MVNTENLVIVMADIAGLSETAVQQSRAAIDAVLAAHQRVLLPLVRRYRGRHIKSMGHTLLLVFRSPTDALLCAMAMQDVLYEYNRSTSADKQIHIRIGASLGEVRVTRQDILGEPLNLTSRILGITPADEIYFSEALYMAMKKAEVAAQELGWKELKGATQQMRIYHIPRFAVPRLVSDPMAAEDLSDLVYPYGGAHLIEQSRDTGAISVLARRKSVRALALALLLIPAAVLAVYMVRPETSTVPAGAAPERAPRRSAELPEATLPPRTPVKAVELTPAPAPIRAVPPVVAPAKTAVAKPQDAPKPQAKRVEPPKPGYQRIQDAKKAYKENKITKPEYKEIVTALKTKMEGEIEQAKRDYKAGTITKPEYKKLVDDIEQRYE